MSLSGACVQSTLAFPPFPHPLPSPTPSPLPPGFSPWEFVHILALLCYFLSFPLGEGFYCNIRKMDNFTFSIISYKKCPPSDDSKFCYEFVKITNTCLIVEGDFIYSFLRNLSLMDLYEGNYRLVVQYHVLRHICTVLHTPPFKE